MENVFGDYSKIKNALKKSTCIVLGDIMLDIYLYGSVKRISPEAPIPIVSVERKKSVLGGSANVACNINGYGVHTLLCGLIGEDQNGKYVKKELDKRNIEFVGIESNERHTTVKTRIVGMAQQIVRYDEEISEPILKTEEEILLGQLKKALSEADVLIISDYNKGICTDAVCKEAIRMAKENDIIVMVDPKTDYWDKYCGADIVTPNFNEFCEAIGKKIPNEEFSIKDNGGKLLKDYQLKSLLVTRSECGMTLLEEDKAYTFEAMAQEVFDVSGAGDTVIATYAAFVGAGVEKRKAAEIANAAAGFVVSKVGTYEISLEELKECYDDNHIEPDCKIVTIDLLCKKLVAWKKVNKRIVFTNGCFDILHAGHIDYLQRAKQLGDILIVGINTDKSVKTLKGENRPINCEQDRAFVLSALSMVDAVILFDEDTPYNLIKFVEPNVLVKGGDYKIEDVVGREFAEEVYTLDFLKGHSTTSIIDKIRNVPERYYTNDEG